MYILNIDSPRGKMPVNEIRDFIFENYYNQIGFYKENSYYSMKQKDLLVYATKLAEKST